MYKKNFEEKNLVPWDLPGVPRVPISGPNRGIFSKLIGPGPLGSGGHSHTSFSNGRFQALETSFHIDVVTKGRFENSRLRQYMDPTMTTIYQPTATPKITCKLVRLIQTNAH